jgi:hypothetical protein
MAQTSGRPTFDPATLEVLDRAVEVDIETMRPDGMPRLTTIWLVVDGQDVFARSWRGDRGYWYQAAREHPETVTLHVGRQAIPVRVVPASDEASIDRCSVALSSKYAADPSTPAMLAPAARGTTIRLEPR